MATLALSFLPRLASSTTDEMAKLPSSSRFQCLICHTTAEPVVGSSELNAFGIDFQQNERIWNRALALENSDEDNCANGFELGDADGDGVLDAGVEEENSNPGDPTDCLIAINERTWGKIKELFSGN